MAGFRTKHPCQRRLSLMRSSFVCAVAWVASVGALAPDFDSFVTHAVGKWKGAAYCWQRTAENDDYLPLGVAPGYITPPSACSTEVSEVMRSCGGAVQGVQEERRCQPADGTVALNRQVDGTTFFTYGSWANAPALLSDGAESDLLTSPKCFGISVNLAHADATRRRLLLVISDASLLCCDVAIEQRMPPGDLDAELDDEVAAALLQRRVQCVVEANAWEGGASKLTLSGSSPSEDWINARTKWSVVEGDLEGGTPLVPASGENGDVAYMPGGCWVRVAPRQGGGTLVEVGSIAAAAGEVKAITHAYDPVAGGGSGLQLSKVEFSKITAR